VRVFRRRPSDLERAILVWSEVERRARATIHADTTISPANLELADSVLDTVTMEMSKALVQQANEKAQRSRTTVLKTEKTETTSG